MDGRLWRRAWRRRVRPRVKGSSWSDPSTMHRTNRPGDAPTPVGAYRLLVASCLICSMASGQDSNHFFCGTSWGERFWCRKTDVVSTKKAELRFLVSLSWDFVCADQGTRRTTAMTGSTAPRERTTPARPMATSASAGRRAMSSWAMGISSSMPTSITTIYPTRASAERAGMLQSMSAASPHTARVDSAMNVPMGRLATVACRATCKIW